jgi:ATP-dependent Lon protease
VGAIKEKIIAAKRAELKRIIIPKGNVKDLDEIPDYIKKGLTFFPVNDIVEVLDITFKNKKKKR